MRGPRSLQLRLALALGGAVLFLWLAAAAITAERLRVEMNAVFDAGLADTAHRILPLVLRGGHERRDRDRFGGNPRRDDEDEDRFERIQRLPETEDVYAYVVFDPSGAVILSSEDADPALFPPYERDGFVQTGNYRFFFDRAGHSGPTIAVAEPLSHRSAVAREMAMRLSLPLLGVVPLSLLAILLVVRGSLAPLRNLRDDLAARDARNLAPLAGRDLPSELTPVIGSINALLSRLGAAFEAERSFAANAAHELRTPVAGAIAQAQRLRAETEDARASARAGEIETTLKRLGSLSEKLMQLARAEGARLRTDQPADLRPVLRIVAEDFQRLGAAGRLHVDLPDAPVLSDLDPDAFGIVLRNLIENALKHGAEDGPVHIRLTGDATLAVTNAGPVIPAEDLTKLTDRFARATDAAEGSGLGLAIVRTIADRAGATLDLHSPAPAREDGVEVRMRFT